MKKNDSLIRFISISFCSLILIIFFIGAVNPYSGYLPRYRSNSSFIVPLVGISDSDSTAGFQPRQKTSIHLHVEGASDSIHWVIYAMAGPNNYRDSLHTCVIFDSATVTTPGSSFLIWANDSTKYIVSPGSDIVYLRIESHTGNGYWSTGIFRIGHLVP